MRDSTLVVFARAPELGKVKTRLARELGEQRALSIYRALLLRTAETARHWPGPILLATTGDDRAYAGTGFERQLRCLQVEGGLGVRLAAALQAGLQLAPRAIVIGTDCPGLRPHHLGHLLSGLVTADAVFGPATDGGFWGACVAEPGTAELLGEPTIPWSHTSTLAAARQHLHLRGITTGLGPLLSDVDTPADYAAAVAAGLLQDEDLARS